jgi:hypothetical protein
MYRYAYKKLSLLIDKQRQEKNLFGIVFTQHNMHAPNQILSTIHLSVLPQAQTTSPAQHAAYVARDGQTVKQ